MNLAFQTHPWHKIITFQTAKFGKQDCRLVDLRSSFRSSTLYMQILTMHPALCCHESSLNLIFLECSVLVFRRYDSQTCVNMLLDIAVDLAT